MLIDLLAGFVRRLEGGCGHRLKDGGIGLLVELRDEDIDIHQQVTLAVAIDGGESLATQTEDLAWLRACSDVHTCLPTDRRYLDGATLGGCRYGDEEVVDEVIAVADEVGILFFLDDDLQVTGDTTAGSCVPLALDGELHTRGDPSRDAEGYDLFADLRALPLTEATGLGDDLARTLTGGADGLRLHHAEDTALSGDDDARAVARVALLLAVLLRGAVSVTVGAGDLLLHLELLLYALVDLLEGEADASAKVGAAQDLTATAATSAEASEVKATEATTSEEVAEAAEDIFHRHASAEATATAGGAASDTGMTELVVALALLWIAQYVIGLSKLLELLFGLLVPGILVGVIFDGELAVGLLQLFGRSALSYAKDFIVISLFCHR